MSTLHSEHKYIDLREDQLYPGLTKFAVYSEAKFQFQVAFKCFLGSMALVFFLFLINNLLVN